MIYDINDMSILPTDFYFKYFTVFPLTFKMFKERFLDNFTKDGMTKDKQLLHYYDYKKQMGSLPHYRIVEEQNIKTTLQRKT